MRWEVDPLGLCTEIIGGFCPGLEFAAQLTIVQVQYLLSGDQGDLREGLAGCPGLDLFELSLALRAFDDQVLPLLLHLWLFLTCERPSSLPGPSLNSLDSLDSLAQHPLPSVPPPLHFVPSPRSLATRMPNI